MQAYWAYDIRGDSKVMVHNQTADLLFCRILNSCVVLQQWEEQISKFIFVMLSQVYVARIIH